MGHPVTPSPGQLQAPTPAGGSAPRLSPTVALEPRAQGDIFPVGLNSICLLDGHFSFLLYSNRPNVALLQKPAPGMAASWVVSAFFFLLPGFQTCGLYLHICVTSFPSPHLRGVPSNNSLINTHCVPTDAACSSLAREGKGLPRSPDLMEFIF